MLVPVTEQDIFDLAKKLNEYAAWLQYRNLARLYEGSGKHVHKFFVTTYQEYDNGGDLRTYIDDVVAYNRQGTEIEFTPDTAEVGTEYWRQRAALPTEDKPAEFEIIVAFPPQLPTLYIQENA
jgi:hypothetical protein